MSLNIGANQGVIQFAEVLRSIREQGFTFKEAKEIYLTYNTEVKNEFIFNEIFELDRNVKTSATECYLAYVNYCEQNNLDVPTQTAFGLNMIKFASRVRTRTGMTYNVKIKEIANE